MRLLASGKTNSSCEESCDRAVGEHSCCAILFAAWADYSIRVKSQLTLELRVLRIWPSLGSWEIFLEEETSELDFKEQICAGW